VNYSEVKNYTDTHPTLQLIKERQAPLILSFFFQVFGDDRLSPRKDEELLIYLSSILDDLSEEEEEETLLSARNKLELWCSEKKRYLRRYTNDHGEILYELTSHSEKAMHWIEDLVPREFVGTESRFSSIYNRIKELVEGSQVDPEIRIKQLEGKRTQIDKEIEEIKNTGTVQSFESWQVRERFDEISRSARELLSDFKLIEENFKDIIQQLFESEMKSQRTRGDLLRLTLDASEEMAETPQGKSFKTFWQFLSTDMGHDGINNLVKQAFDLLGDDDSLREDSFLSDLKFYLHEGGMRILERNHKLAEKLNRILLDNQFYQIHAIREQIREIQSTVLNLGENTPDVSDFLFIHGSPEISLPMERPPSLPREETSFALPEERSEEIVDFSVLYDPMAIDQREIRSKIQEALSRQVTVSLEELIKDSPPRKGLGEILAYINEASRSRKARIFSDEFVTVEYQLDNYIKTLSIPKVVFYK
jgi:hypothetical protein